MNANQENIKSSCDNTASFFFNENLEIGIKSKFLSIKNYCVYLFNIKFNHIAYVFNFKDSYLYYQGLVVQFVNKILHFDLMIIVNQEHEDLFSHWFNEIKETPLFPFGDWRDLCYSTQIKSSEEVSVKSSDPTVNLEFMSTYEHQKPQISKANFIEDGFDEKHINLNNCVSSQETETISSVWMLHKVFKVEKMRGQKRYTNRRDVITKSIIRYFYKYLWRFLKQYILNPRYMKSINTLTQRVKDVWSNLEDYKNNYVSNNNPFDKELNQFIFWMIGKKQSYLNRQFGNKYFSNNFNKNFENMINIQWEASIIMINILKNYSHSHLQRFFENKSLWVLFKVFMGSESENYLNQIPICKRAKTEEVLRDFETNILLHNN